MVPFVSLRGSSVGFGLSSASCILNDDNNESGKHPIIDRDSHIISQTCSTLNLAAGFMCVLGAVHSGIQQNELEMICKVEGHTHTKKRKSHMDSCSTSSRQHKMR